MGKCSRCKEDKAELIQGVCVDCIFALGSKIKSITRSDVERVKREVELETAGLFPPQTLLSLLEQYADALDSTEDRDLLTQHTANEIQRLGGLG